MSSIYQLLSPIYHQFITINSYHFTIVNHLASIYHQFTIINQQSTNTNTNLTLVNHSFTTSLPSICHHFIIIYQSSNMSSIYQFLSSIYHQSIINFPFIISNQDHYSSALAWKHHRSQWLPLHTHHPPGFTNAWHLGYQGVPKGS